MKKIFGLVALLVLMALAGCGTSSSNSIGLNSSQRGSILLSQVLARAIPSGVTSQRFTGYGATGALLYGPLVADKSATTLLVDVPAEVVSLQIEQLQGKERVAIGSVDVVIQPGQTTPVVDPPTQSLPAEVVAVQVTPGEASIPQNGARKFHATAVLADNEQLDISGSLVWSSSNLEVARANSSGRVGAVAPGNTTITARLGSIASSSKVTVNSTSIVSLEVSPASASIADDTSQQMTALAGLSDGSFEDVTSVVKWTVSGDATVNDSGLLIAGAPGTLGVTASVADSTATVPLEVTAATPVDIVVSPHDGAAMVKGTSQRMQATAIFSDSSRQDVTELAAWTSSAPGQARVNNLGIVKASESGPVEISASFRGVSGVAALTVDDRSIVALRVEPSSLQIADDTEAQLRAVATYSDGSESVLSEGLGWRSSAPDVFTVLPSGLLTGVNPGEATVQVSLPGSSQTAGGGVSVRAAKMTGLAVNPPEALSAAGTARKFQAIASFSDATTQDVTESVVWRTDNPNISFSEQSQDSANDGRANIETDATSDALGSTITASIGAFNASAKLQVNQFIYLLDSSSNLITAYRMDSKGNLTQLGTTSVSQPNAMAIEPNGRYAYVLSRMSPGITTYIIQPDGILRSVGLPISVPGGARSVDLEVHPNGRFLYATNGGGKVAEYQIGVDGGLSSMGAVDSVDPGSVAVSASGDELFVTNASEGRLSTFSIDAAGHLALKGKAVVGRSNGSLENLEFVDSRPYATLLATDNTAQTIVTLGPDPDKQLAPIATYSVDVRFGAASVIANDTLGRFCYALVSDTLNILRFQTNGKLQFSDSNFILNAGTAEVTAIRVDPSGRFLIFPNYDADSVSTLEIEPDGRVTPRASAPFTSTLAGANGVETTP